MHIATVRIATLQNPDRYLTDRQSPDPIASLQIQVQTLAVHNQALKSWRWRVLAQLLLFLSSTLIAAFPAAVFLTGLVISSAIHARAARAI